MISIIFDTETTGLLKPAAIPLEQQPKIIELGALKVDGDKIIGELSQLIDPEEPLTAIITKITGIKDEDLADKPPFYEYFPLLVDFFEGTDMLICHNAFFDTGMLKNEISRLSFETSNENVRCAIKFPWPAETICTVQEYKALLGKWPKMTELYEKIIGKPLAQTHRALDDCKALHEILVADKFFDKIKEK